MGTMKIRKSSLSQELQRLGKKLKLVRAMVCTECQLKVKNLACPNPFRWGSVNNIQDITDKSKIQELKSTIRVSQNKLIFRNTRWHPFTFRCEFCMSQLYQR